MKILIIYDSMYGNTEKIADSLAKAFPKPFSVKVLWVSNVNQSELDSVKLLIIGSPTHGGRPTRAISEFINHIPANVLKNIIIAVFDTRIPVENQNFFIRILINTFGYAAERMADNIRAKGGQLALLAPEGFYVDGKKGPLRKGELERAIYWIKDIQKNLNYK